MRIAVVTLFPEMLAAVTRYGVTGRAVQAGLLEVVARNPRDWASDRHGTVDDRPYGGGPGMVMKAQPLVGAIRSARAAVGPEAPVLALSPQGRRLDQGYVRELASLSSLVLVAGRYEGVDERALALAVDAEVSIGDYVLSGGELAAMVVIDALARLRPGTVGDAASVAAESFETGLLDHPHYTRPERVDGLEVPEVLLSGDHAAVARWRRKQALGRTWERRPDLIETRELDATERELLDEYIRECQVNAAPGNGGAPGR